MARGGAGGNPGGGGLGRGAAGKAAEPDGAALVKGNSEFALDLYARLRARDGNLFFSSYSISNALAMTYAGARGPTATQMAAALRFPDGRGSPASKLRQGQPRRERRRRQRRGRAARRQRALDPDGPCDAPRLPGDCQESLRSGPHTPRFQEGAREGEDRDQCLGRTADAGPDQGAHPRRHAQLRHAGGPDQRHLLQGQVEVRVPRGGHAERQVHAVDGQDHR